MKKFNRKRVIMKYLRDYFNTQEIEFDVLHILAIVGTSPFWLFFSPFICGEVLCNICSIMVNGKARAWYGFEDIDYVLELENEDKTKFLEDLSKYESKKEK